MRLHHTSAAFADLCAHALDLADSLPGTEAELRKRYEAESRDGYPTSSMVGGGARTSRMDEKRDEDGNVIYGPDGKALEEPVPSDYADPVGELVIAEATADPHAAALQRAHLDVVAARKLLVHAQAVMLAQLQHHEVQDDLSRDWCWSCAQWTIDGRSLRKGGTQILAPAYRDSDIKGTVTFMPRCRRCYQFAQTEGRNPPAGVCRAWARGITVTSKVIETALREERETRVAQFGRRAS